MEKQVFRGFQDIENAVRTANRFGFLGFAFGLVALVVCCIFVFTIYNSSLNSQFAIDVESGKAHKLTQTEAESNQKAEIKHHISMFYGYFLNLEPNKESIDKNINNALYLGDDCLKELYQIYLDNGFYNQLIQKNIITRGWVDSVYNIDINTEPFTAEIVGKQKLIRGKNEILKHYNVTCEIRKVSERTEKNSHGLFFTTFTVINNKPIINE